jgi:hypothetical protein
MWFEDSTGREGWPADMLLSEERREHMLMMLLFTRSVVLDADPAALRDGDLEARWLGAWTSATVSLARRSDGQAGDVEALRPAASWRRQLAEHLGHDFLVEHEDAYEAWLDEHAPADAELSFDDRAVPDLVEAWTAGLRTLVVVPLAGPVTVPLSASTLMLSTSTREHVRQFRDALQRFSATSPLR